MPFTGSHPAAVLPFLRSGLPPSALIIGSIAPDIPYYAPTPIVSHFTHTLLGAATVDEAIAGAVFIGWQAFLGAALVAYAPSALRDRLERAAPAGLRAHCGSASRLLRTLAAMFLGSVTHIYWDAFTHRGEWGASHIAWLAARHGPLPGYEWAQYASGLLGAFAIAWWCARWWRRQPRIGHGAGPVGALAAPARHAAAAWSLVAAAATIGAVLGARYGIHQDDPVRSAFFFAATKGMSAGALAVLLLAAVWAWRARRRTGSPVARYGGSAPLCGTGAGIDTGTSGRGRPR